MKPSRLLWLLALCLPTFLSAQTQISKTTIASFLDMEDGFVDPTGVAIQIPPGWQYGSTQDRNYIATDGQVAQHGSKSARLRRDASSQGSSSGMSINLPMDFGGSTIEVTGWLRGQGVSGAGYMYIFEADSSRNQIAYASTNSPQNRQPITGTTEWVQFKLTLPIIPAANTFFVGVTLQGTGTLWADNFQILVDGQPIAGAPAKAASVLDTDTAFAAGSKVASKTFSDVQIKNLVKLAKVWGFLKYHHPSVVAGERNWDFDLFRVLPNVIAAADETGANAAILSWANTYGPVKQCSSCATLDAAGVAVNPGIDWIRDANYLGAQLSQLLQDVYRNRPNGDVQFFAMLHSTQGNAIFLDEPQYQSLTLPDPGYQLLGLFRAWNMVEYFYPYRNLISGDPATARQYWDDVLAQSIPRVAQAPDFASYKVEMTRFMAGINDSQSNMIHPEVLRPPNNGTGLAGCQLPIELRWIGGSVVVGRLTTNNSRIPWPDFQQGDVLQSFDGKPVADLIAQWRPYYGDSNDASMMRDMLRQFTNGPCGQIPAVVKRGGADVSVTVQRVNPNNGINLTPLVNQHDLPATAATGTVTFQKLSGDTVAYMKTYAYSTITGNNTPLASADIPRNITSASGTKGLIFDLRNSNGWNEDYGAALIPLMISTPTNVAKFTVGDLANPGSFRWAGTASYLPAEPHYSGKVVVLVDELTQGLAEYTAVALRAAGAVIVGSTTAGSPAFYTSTVPLPGGSNGAISGVGVYQMNGKPIERTGVVADYVVNPTIAGYGAGKDEQLDAAVNLITSGALDTPRITLVANAESEGPTIAPNTWVMIKGTNLAPASTRGKNRIWNQADFDAAGGKMPSQVEGVSVTINGKNAFVWYVSPEQINVLAPTDAIDGQVAVVVTNNGAKSDAYMVQAQAISPSFFYVGTYVLSQHLDYSLVGAASMSVPGYPFTPAKPGEGIILYANGFGPTSADVVNGAATQSGELQPRPTVTIGGVAASVDWAGLISPGLYQLNVTVPSSLADGDYPIVATYKGASTQSGLMITVKQ